MDASSYLQYKQLIYRGAEAEVYFGKYLGFDVVIKRRIPKSYRIRQLDEHIRATRTKREAALMVAAQAVIAVPHILDVDLVNGVIVMEYVAGPKLRDCIDTAKALMIGRDLRRLHAIDVVHGDLTTSNMIWHGGRIWYVDFGLAQRTRRIEDKATDLVVLKKMIASTHFDRFEQLWKAVCRGYADEQIISKMAEIERRARYVER